MNFGVGFAFLQGDTLVEIMHSPVIVPVAALAMALGISVAKIWSGVRTREMQSQERLAAMAKGLPVLSEPLSQLPVERVHQVSAVMASARGGGRDWTNSRRAGIVLLSIGLGLIAFFVCLAAIIQVREVLIPAAAGLIPLALGVGFLVEARMRRRELGGAMGAGNGLGEPPPAAAVFGAPAPPPPVYAPSFSMADVPRAANGEPETTTLKPYEQEI